MSNLANNEAYQFGTQVTLQYNLQRGEGEGHLFKFRWEDFRACHTLLSPCAKVLNLQKKNDTGH